MLTPYQPSAEQPWNLQRVVHLHRRAGFAPRWSDIQRDLSDGPEVAVSRLLEPNPNPKTGATSDAAREFEQMSAVIGAAAVGSSDINRLKAWWLYRMLFTTDPLSERLTLLWHNHFATSNLKVANVGLMHQQYATLSQLCRGSFRDLLRRMANDPALLVWLDADANRKEHPNENLARETMELFSLGVGNFSDDDVKAAARAITGWSVSQGKFHFHDEYHDDGEKTILGRTGSWTGDDFVHMLLDHPATSQRLALRICELFFGENIPTDHVRDEIARGLLKRDLDIRWAIETVLRSEAFFRHTNIGNRVLSPVEFVVGAIRSLEMTDPPPSTLLLAEVAAKLGQDLFAPPNVFGWPGGRSWLTSGAVIGRANFASALVGGQLRSAVQPLDAARLARSHGFTAPAEMSAFFAQLLLGQPHLPSELLTDTYLDKPNQLVTAILASPAAQLA